MTQREKLIERLQRVRSDADAADVRRLLEQHGWTVQAQTGSHLRFGKPGEPHIAYPLVSGRRVKAVYVRRVLKRLSGDAG